MFKFNVFLTHVKLPIYYVIGLTFSFIVVDRIVSTASRQTYLGPAGLV